MLVVRTEITGEDQNYVYGKRFVNDEFTSTWCQSKGPFKAINITEGINPKGDTWTQSSSQRESLESQPKA